MGEGHKKGQRESDVCKLEIVIDRSRDLIWPWEPVNKY